MKSLTTHLLLIAGLFFIGPDMVHANTEPGYKPHVQAGAQEAVGPEINLCPQCAASCAMSRDYGADRGGQSCKVIVERAQLLVEGGSTSTRPPGKDDRTN